MALSSFSELNVSENKRNKYHQYHKPHMQVILLRLTTYQFRKITFNLQIKKYLQKLSLSLNAYIM